MPELGPYGSVRGARGNSRPYRESDEQILKAMLMTQLLHSDQMSSVGSVCYRGWTLKAIW